ncbi:MAG: hypothetical protein L0Y73_06430 [Candidatus Aminicenantes bacterium]|nr:hypothetical protein [Candidatus Aminicenantes bacterium]
MKDEKALGEFPAALGLNPKDDKVREGDRCTPEGRFYICEVIKNPQPATTYGPISLRISYPNITGCFIPSSMTPFSPATNLFNIDLFERKS